MPDASYLITAYLIVLTVFSLWVNSRSQTVWDALRADGALYAAAGRPSDMYFVFDIYRLCYRYAFFLKKPSRQTAAACLLRRRLPCGVQAGGISAVPQLRPRRGNHRHIFVFSAFPLNGGRLKAQFGCSRIPFPVFQTACYFHLIKEAR